MSYSAWVKAGAHPTTDAEPCPLQGGTRSCMPVYTDCLNLVITAGYCVTPLTMLAVYGVTGRCSKLVYKASVSRYMPSPSISGVGQPVTTASMYTLKFASIM